MAIVIRLENCYRTAFVTFLEIDHSIKENNGSNNHIITNNIITYPT